AWAWAEFDRALRTTSARGATSAACDESASIMRADSPSERAGRTRSTLSPHVGPNVDRSRKGADPRRSLPPPYCVGSPAPAGTPALATPRRTVLGMRAGFAEQPPG